MVKLLEEFGVGCSIIAVGFLEAIAVSWFYGNDSIVKSCTFFKWKLVILRPKTLSASELFCIVSFRYQQI